MAIETKEPVSPVIRITNPEGRTVGYSRQELVGELARLKEEVLMATYGEPIIAKAARFWELAVGAMNAASIVPSESGLKGDRQQTVHYVREFEAGGYASLSLQRHYGKYYDYEREKWVPTNDSTFTSEARIHVVRMIEGKPQGSEIDIWLESCRRGVTADDDRQPRRNMTPVGIGQRFVWPIDEYNKRIRDRIGYEVGVVFYRLDQIFPDRCTSMPDDRRFSEGNGDWVGEGEGTRPVSLLPSLTPSEVSLGAARELRKVDEEIVDLAISMMEDPSCVDQTVNQYWGKRALALTRATYDFATEMKKRGPKKRRK